MSDASSVVEERLLCKHEDIRYFAEQKGAIACMDCGRLFGHFNNLTGWFTPHNPTERPQNMSDENIEEAKELGARAAGQGKNAAKNVGRAARAVVEPVVESTAEEIHEVADKAQDTAEDALQAAKRIDPRVLSRISGDTGIGFMALSVSIYTGIIAYSKFRGAYAGRNAVMSARAARPID